MRNTPARLVRAIAVAALTTVVSVPLWSSSTTAEAANQPASTASVVVATFNVRCANCSKHPMNGREKSWETRAPVIVSEILDEKVDVIGVQEASPGLLSGTRTAQFEDLVSRLGSPYAVTDPSRYNCTRTDTTFTRCGGFKNQGASQDAKIIYNTAHLTLLAGGSMRLDGRKVGNGSARYMVWAAFRDDRTGKQFIFATAHFEPGTGKGKTKIRVKQVKKAVPELDRVAGGRPIIWGSDLASSKLTHTGNKSYDAFIARGFTDPIGNKYKAKKPVGAYADAMVNEQYFTLNNFAAAPKSYVSKGYQLGAHLDYILIKKNGHPVDVGEWKEVLRLDSDGTFDGVIPSDHNMVRATVELG
jgi:hypothetical protein